MIDSHCHIQVAAKWSDAKGPAQYCVSAVAANDNKKLLEL